MFFVVSMLKQNSICFLHVRWLLLFGGESVDGLVYHWISTWIALHFLQLHGLLSDKVREQRGLSIWLAVIWSIWLERNEELFNNNRTDVLRLLDLIRSRSWSWYSTAVGGLILFDEWCICPLDCCIRNGS